MSNLTARPTTYKGIEMRSRLEATVAAHFDALGLTWTYEPRCFASPRGQYLPDFEITLKSGGKWYIEVKGPLVGDPHPLQSRMEIIWESEPDARLMLVDSSGDWWFGASWVWVPGYAWGRGLFHIDGLAVAISDSATDAAWDEGVTNWMRRAIGRACGRDAGA